MDSERLTDTESPESRQPPRQRANGVNVRLCPRKYRTTVEFPHHLESDFGPQALVTEAELAAIEILLGGELVVFLKD